MFPQKSGIKKKNSLRNNGSVSLDASLTSIEWLQNMQIGSNVFSETILPRRNSIVEPIAVANAPIEHKIEQKASPQAGEFQNHSKPPFSYVTLIRQAILSSSSRRMTLNEIYQWIIDAYPYFRTAPAKWKNSIRHNLSLNKCFKRLQRSTSDPGKGSYWAVVDVNSSSSNGVSSRKRKEKLHFDEFQNSMNILGTSPDRSSAIFYTDNNPMICGDFLASDCSTLLKTNSSFAIDANSMNYDDMNLDLNGSCRRVREVFDLPTTSWLNSSDVCCSSRTRQNSGNSVDVSYKPETISNSFHNEINWHDFHHDHLRWNGSNLPTDDCQKLLTLASSFSSLFDFNPLNCSSNGKTMTIQEEKFHQLNDSNGKSRFLINPHCTLNETNNQLHSFPTISEDDTFDWDTLI